MEHRNPPTGKDGGFVIWSNCDPPEVDGYHSHHWLQKSSALTSGKQKATWRCFFFGWIIFRGENFRNKMRGIFLLLEITLFFFVWGGGWGDEEFLDSDGCFYFLEEIFTGVIKLYRTCFPRGWQNIQNLFSDINLPICRPTRFVDFVVLVHFCCSWAIVLATSRVLYKKKSGTTYVHQPKSPWK